MKSAFDTQRRTEARGGGRAEGAWAKVAEQHVWDKQRLFLPPLLLPVLIPALQWQKGRERN